MCLCVFMCLFAKNECVVRDISCVVVWFVFVVFSVVLVGVVCVCVSFN